MIGCFGRQNVECIFFLIPLLRKNCIKFFIYPIISKHLEVEVEIAIVAAEAAAVIVVIALLMKNIEVFSKI